MTIKHQKGDVDLEAIIRELSTKVVKVGFFEHSKYPDGTPIAYIASIQENGFVGRSIPARPFMRPAMDDNKLKHQDGVAAAFRRAVKKTQTITQGLEQLGEVLAGDVRQAITNVTSPPLSPITLLLRQQRKNGGKVTGRTVGNAARAALFLPSEGAAASLGVSEKPLVDSGLMFQAVTYSVEVK